MLTRIGSETAGSYNFLYRYPATQQGAALSASALGGLMTNQSMSSPSQSYPGGNGEPNILQAQTSTAAAKTVSTTGPRECETCKNRKYQDGSDDPGVSMKTPTKISPENAAAAVISHEFEHVFREQDAAAQEDREVVSQSVQIHTAVCPECGRVYVSGGRTYTVTKEKDDFEPDSEIRLGKLWDGYA
jgi:hypothetical protein